MHLGSNKELQITVHDLSKVTDITSLYQVASMLPACMKQADCVFFRFFLPPQPWLTLHLHNASWCKLGDRMSRPIRCTVYEGFELIIKRGRSH